jgi:hypothetical protein
LSSVIPLTHGKSFNNRIYYLRAKVPQNQDLKYSSLAFDDVELVLKVNGRFFGASKIQNEVACLCMIQALPVHIPVPRVIAWSDDGETVNRILPGGKTMQVSHSSSIRNVTTKRVWILMTKLKGDPIAVDTLRREDIQNLAIQLADIVANWRTNLPTAVNCGNISIVGADQDSASVFKTTPSSIQGLSFAIGTSILGNDLQFSSPVSSMYEYFHLKLEDRLDKLNTLGPMEENRHLVPSIKEFIEITLPKLQIFTQHAEEEGEFVFTHYDLAPRNVLVSGNPPQIRGIVDFEFAGYIPDLEEFLNDANNNFGDWPSSFYDAYLHHLEILGVATPLSGTSAYKVGTAYNTMVARRGSKGSQRVEERAKK